MSIAIRHFLCIVIWMLKEKVLKAKNENPTFGYRKLGELLGCNRDTVRYHLSEHRRKMLRDKETIYRKDLKELLIQIAGGKCSSCGYSKCIQALQFHHNGDEKKSNNISNLRRSAAIEEIKKCDLLCANCHAERHYLTVP